LGCDTLYIVHRDQHIQKTFCLHKQDIASTPKMDRAGFSNISVIGCLLASHHRGLRLISGPVHVGFVVDKQHWDRFFSDCFHFPMLLSFHRCSQTHISFLWHHQCYVILEVDFVCVICLPNYMVPCHRSSYLRIYHCEQLVQSCPFIKLIVLMEIPDLWLQTARVHLSSPNCCMSVSLNLVS